MPTILNRVTTPVVSSDSVLVDFRTLEPAYSYAEYGTTTSYGSKTIGDPARLYREHATIITDLLPDTTYHYRVVVVNDEGTTFGEDQTFTTASVGTNVPALPVQVDTRMPDLTGAVEETVKTSGGTYTPEQFQKALDNAAAAPGKRILTIDAGLTFTGNFTLGSKIDAHWILIRSSAHASLPEGKRVIADQSGSMFKITSASVDAPLVTAAKAHHWRIVGMELTVESSAMVNVDIEQAGVALVGLGQSAANLPHHIIFDRCYIHGVEDKSTRRGLYLAGCRDSAVIDCCIDEFHSTGGDAQGILAVSCQRLKVLNNTISCGGENFMSGGTGALPGFVVSDIDYRHNYHFWYLKWKRNHPSYAGINWVIKCQFELKTSNRVFVFGNLWAQYWTADQDICWNIKCEQNSDPAFTQDLQQDLVFYKNLGRKIGQGITVTGRPGSGGPLGVPSRVRPSRVWVFHNLFEIDGATWDDENFNVHSPGEAMRMGDTDHLHYKHNTFINANPPVVPDRTGGRLLLVPGIGETDLVKPPSKGFVCRDNIVDHREYGVFASGAGMGKIALDTGLAPDYQFTKNLIIGGNSALYPPGNIFRASWGEVKLVSFNNGVGGDYRLAPDSPGKNAASDGTDIGADIDGVMAATDATATGNWGSVSVTPQPIPTPEPTQPTPTPTTPTPAPSGTPSPDGTKGATIIDSQLATWTLGPNKETLRDGKQVGGGQGDTYKYLTKEVYTWGDVGEPDPLKRNWYKWLASNSSWSSVGTTEPGGAVTQPEPIPVPPPTPTPVPTVPSVRKVAWPTTETKQNAVVEAQWKERYRFRRHLSGAYAEFEKVV